MLADQLDYVIGVDPHRDTHALAVVDVRSGASSSRRPWSQMASGYACVLRLADQHAPGKRAFAVEGTGSLGAGLTRFLVRHDERVLEVGRLRRERSSGGKTDALDAIRAARSVLAQTRPAEPRAGGEREALRALSAAREGAVTPDGPGSASYAACSCPRPSRYARAPLADPSAASASARGDSSGTTARLGAARDAARAPRGRPARPAADR